MFEFPLWGKSNNSLSILFSVEEGNGFTSVCHTELGGVVQVVKHNDIKKGAAEIQLHVHISR